MKQAILNNFFKRKGSPEHKSDSSSGDESVYLPSKSKRMYDTPMSWTRVKYLEQAVNKRVTIFDVETDLLTDKNLKKIRKDSVREVGTLLFDPEAFKESECELTFAKYRLDKQQLHGYAKAAIKIRKSFSEKAADILTTAT